MHCVVIALVISCSGTPIKMTPAEALAVFTSNTSPYVAPPSVEFYLLDDRPIAYDRSWPFERSTSDLMREADSRVPWSVTVYTGRNRYNPAPSATSHPRNGQRRHP